MPGLLHVILLLQFCRTGAAAATSGEVDSNDWAKDIVSAKSGELNREERIRAERAAYHARRSAAAASAAARAAEEVLSLSQRSAQRPKVRHRLAPSLATIALSSEDSATRRAVAAATAAAEAERRAEGFAAKALAPEAGSATTTAPAKQAPAPSREEELMYQRERMAAQTAGLCVLSICIVLAWFQSNAVEGDYHRRKKDEADIDVFHRCGILCCCCRRMACCAWCCYKLLGLLASCSCSTLSVLGTVVFLMGYGFKELWDQHLIQPHLEEATIYLFFATIAFVILLIMVGAFVNWLRDKVGFVHNVMSFVDERMDDVMDFFGIHAGYDDDDDDLKDFKLPDVHDYDPKQVSNKRASPGKGAMPAANRGRDRLRKAHPWWLGPLLGANRSRRAGRENVREMPV